MAIRGSKQKTRGPTRVTPAKNISWKPGRKGQGGEGFSKGYGGSKGPGTGASGPDTLEKQLRPKAPAPRKTKALR